MGVEKIFSFESWDSDHPADRHPGERIDAQFDSHANAIRALEARIDAIIRADGKLHAEVIPIFSPRQIVAPRSGFSHPGSTNVATLSDAAAENWAEVSMEWAEHMPDTIPGNILATNAITGDHWSARWWASQAARLAARGTVAVIKLQHFPFNGVAVTFPLLDETSAPLVVPAANVSQLSIVVDGVPQEPGVDYVLAAAGASVTFTTAPAADARNFATYAVQGTTDVSSVTVVGATLFATRAVAAAAVMPIDVMAIATGGFASAGDGGGARYSRVAGTTPGGFQSADGQWWALEKGDINVRQYGAVGNGVGDDTVAINLAAAALKAVMFPESGGQLWPAKMVFPSGRYKITGSINLQSISYGVGAGAAEQAWEIDMRGAVIQCVMAGKTAFDCLGSNWGTFRGGLFWGDFTLTPAYAIQIGRLEALPAAGGFVFDHVSFNGKWSKACIYNLQSETNTYIHLGINNWDTNGTAIIIDGLNHVGAVTDFTAPAQPADTIGSTIQNVFLGGGIMAPFGTDIGPPLIDLYAAHQVHFYGAYSLGKGIIVRNTAIGAAGASINDHRYDIHCEQNTINVEFRRLNTAGTFTVHGLYLNDNGAQASAAIINIGTNVSSLNIFDGEFHTAFVTTALFSSAAYVLGGMVMGNNVGVLQIGDGNTALNTGTGSLGRRGTISKVALVAALTAPRVLTLPPASDLPRGWRLEIIDTAGGLSATNMLSVTRAGADTINGAASAIVMRRPYDGIVLMSDGVSKWTFPRTVFDEGTFVPAFSATGCTFSYAAQSGTFTRNGRVVTFDLILSLNTSGNILTANPLTITGLPFTAFGNPVCVVQWNASTATYVNVSALVSGTTLIMRGATVAAASNANALNADALLHPTGGSSLRISGAYTV